jgi:hypothetical protein
MAAVDYTYELRRDDHVLSTGHLRLEQPAYPGDVVDVNGLPCEVVEVIPSPAGPRLLLRQ